MKIEYRQLSLRPYPGEILLFRSLAMMRAKYQAVTGEPYPYEDERTGGRYVRLEGRRSCDTQWLVYGRRPHVLAHELSHVLLRVFEDIGCDPGAGKGEPFCYMLSQLMLEAK